MLKTGTNPPINSYKRLPILKLIRTKGPRRSNRAALRSIRQTVGWQIILLVGLILTGPRVASSEIYLNEAQSFVDMQRDNYNVMLTGQGRLKRACSVPLDSVARTNVPLPDLVALSAELDAESERFNSRASARYSAAKRDEALQCKNPLGKVLELFGAKSACSEAGETTLTRQNILRVSAEWDRLLESQTKVLTDARELEASGCLSAGFTSKLTQAYRDSVRPQGVPLGALFDRWTSDQ